MESIKIGQVAREAGVTVDTIRFYERRGVIPPPEREPSGYRRYPASTAGRIRLTRSLQALGFTLDEVVDALVSLDAGDATCAGERWRLERVLERIDTRLDELQRVRAEVVDVLQESQTGSCRLCRDAAGQIRP
ncbi:MAG: MerR family DNA-binding transcriptional regulator [Candidatus Dormibacteraeota bacterium]|nr:MerR family DNA-binding transcriptional regulator [Candidatus Dormibacteraeota bacterium]